MLRKPLALLTVIWVILGPAIALSSPRDPLVRRYNISHLDVIASGDGFSIFSQKPRTGTSCVEFETDTSTAALTAGQKVSVNLQEVTNSSQLADFMDVSVSGRLSAGFGNASASAHFIHNLEINSYDYFLAVRSLVTNEVYPLVKTKKSKN